MSDDAPSVLLERLDARVSRIVLNRPRKRNALDREARRLLLDALDATRDTASVVILTGAQGTFCSGMDLTQLADGDPGQEEELNRSWNRIQDEIRRHPAVFIASAAGYALGGGSTLINVCDLAVVADDVQIGTPELGFGYYPGLAGPAAQLRVSSKQAAWLILTTKRIDGPTAVSWGMANVSVPAERLDDETLALAQHVAGFDAVALEWSKKALWQIPTHISEWRAALEFGAYVNAEIHARTSSHRAALDRFVAGEANPGQGATS